MLDENVVRYQLRLLENNFKLISLSGYREGGDLFAEGKTYLLLIDAVKQDGRPRGLLQEKRQEEKRGEEVRNCEH